VKLKTLHSIDKVKQSRYTPWRRLRREELIFILILDLGTRWGWVVSFTPQPRVNPEERTPVPIVQEAGWAPEPVWTQRLEEKSFRLCRGSNLDRPVVQSVVRHYTDWATRFPHSIDRMHKITTMCDKSAYPGQLKNQNWCYYVRNDHDYVKAPAMPEGLTDFVLWCNQEACGSWNKYVEKEVVTKKITLQTVAWLFC
jgi:hypothetical protein